MTSLPMESKIDTEPPQDEMWLIDDVRPGEQALAAVLPLSGVVAEAVPTDESLLEPAPQAVLSNSEENSSRRRGKRTGEAGPDLVKQYLIEIGRVPLLTKAEEIELAKAREKGLEAQAALTEAKNAYQKRKLRKEIQAGEEAASQFVRANLRLVVSVAKHYTGSGVPLLDIIQDGNLGLLHAVEKFDWRKGFKFSTYATFWIKQSIRRNIADQDRNIRIPLNVVGDMNLLHKYQSYFFNEHGRDPSVRELVEIFVGITDWDEEKIRTMLVSDKPTLSLDLKIGEEQETELSDVIPDASSSAEVDKKANEMHNAEQVDKLLSLADLTEQERAVLKWRSGLMDGYPRKLTEIGTMYGVTRERIRQIERSAENKLRAYRHLNKNEFITLDE